MLVTYVSTIYRKQTHHLIHARDTLLWLLLIRGGSKGGGGAIAPLKPTKVTLFFKILYNPENNISDPIPNKFFVTSNCLVIHCFVTAVL